MLEPANTPHRQRLHPGLGLTGRIGPDRQNGKRVDGDLRCSIVEVGHPLQKRSCGLPFLVVLRKRESVRNEPVP